MRRVLFGVRATHPYRALFTVAYFVGAVWEPELVRGIADVLNGLMALPNLVGVLVLSGLIARETRAYLAQDPDLTDPPSALADYTLAR